jgi:hypothetical protein
VSVTLGLFALEMGAVKYPITEECTSSVLSSRFYSLVGAILPKIAFLKSAASNATCQL